MAVKAVFGQYLSGQSALHRMDPRAKLLLTLALIVVVFCAQGWPGLALCGLFITGLYAVARIPLGQALRAIAPLLFLVVFTVLLNALFVQGGEVYFQWWLICISDEGLARGAFMGTRLFFLLLGVSLLTLTTTTLDITEALERLLKPLGRFGFPAHELGMMMGIALRFLPQFMFELSTIYRAQVSRGATFSASPFNGGLQMLSSLVIPLFTSAFRHAETLSAAMEARCYHGEQGRTRLRPLSYSRLDGFGAAVIALMFAGVIAANIVF